MLIIVITNHYAFMNNKECISFFKKKLKNSIDKKVIYDQSYSFFCDQSLKLSECLGYKVESSGLWRWNKHLNVKKKNIDVYFEGLFSPFQKHIYFKLKPLDINFSCYSAVIPNYFYRAI